MGTDEMTSEQLTAKRRKEALEDLRPMAKEGTLRPDSRQSRQWVADALLAAMPEIEANPRLIGKLTAWIDAGWDRRNDESGVPKSDTLFHGSRADAMKDSIDALMAVVDGESPEERRRIIRTAQKGGYVKPWGRGAGY